MTEKSTSESERKTISDTDRRRAVRERYAEVSSDATAASEASGTVHDGGDGADSCCSDANSADDAAVARSLSVGYADEEVDEAPAAANLGLGCGNPNAIASLGSDDVVLDLGSGGGFDCFLAAEAVGPDGRVIGVDMTPEMIERARETAREQDATNVEFRLGEIEHLPVADAMVDVVISNCVVNLSPDKRQVFEEAYRVLQPGGRIAIADVVQTAEPPAEFTVDFSTVTGCAGGAATVGELESILEAGGFEAIEISPKADSESFVREWDEERDLSEYVAAATIEARKPER